MNVNELTFDELRVLVEGNFDLEDYDLGKLVEDFTSQNKLFPPLSQVKTSKGILVCWDEKSHAIFYKESDSSIAPVLGGSGKGGYYKRTYTLEGNLKWEPVLLKVERSWRQHYEDNSPARSIGFEPRVYDKAIGNPEIKEERLDNFPYWFITPPKVTAQSKE